MRGAEGRAEDPRRDHGELEDAVPRLMVAVGASRVVRCIDGDWLHLQPLICAGLHLFDAWVRGSLLDVSKNRVLESE